MKYDRITRQAKYQSVKARLELHGFAVSIGTEANDLDCMVVRHQASVENGLTICGRERGWYVGFPSSRITWHSIYKLPDQEGIYPLLSMIRSSNVPIARQFDAEVIQHFGLHPISVPMWFQDEAQEEAGRWQRFGWHTISEDEIRLISLRYESFFFPQGELLLPPPFHSWNVTELPHSPPEEYEIAEAAITMHALLSFQRCVSPIEDLLVLDWQHSCYRFNVHKGIQSAYRDYWARPILTSGDDSIFLEPSFRFGLMSLRDGGFHVFGEPLLRGFLESVPSFGPLREWLIK